MPRSTHQCHSGDRTSHSPMPQPGLPPCWPLSTDAIPLSDSAVSCHAGTGEASLCDASTSDTSSYRQERKISSSRPAVLQERPSLMAATKGSSEPSTPLTQATFPLSPPSLSQLCCLGSLDVQEGVPPHQIPLPGERTAAFQPWFGFCRSPASDEWHWEKA